jgi:predicted  nucleic acid-binding Zn-ribbon protein
LNTNIAAVNKGITDLNAKAKAAKTQAELDALNTTLTTLTAQLKTNTTQVGVLATDIDAISAKLHA